jgi:PTS system N-acetylglucosamine-specific IIC component
MTGKNPDPTAGAFMSGFFPVMMFGLPGACLAMYHTARKERRPAVAGLLLSLGLTSFLTGVTEPVEFTFMFLAPVLYALHAVATGIAMVLMHVFGVRLGFGFSAGLFDYVLNFNHAQRPLLLLPIGAVYFALYYVVFRVLIVRMNLATPGREVDDPGQPLAAPSRRTRGQDFVTALGGIHNLSDVAACTTRLRLVVIDNASIDEAALKRLGARGILRSSTQGLQVVLGPIADQVAGEIRAAWRSPGAPLAAASADPDVRAIDAPALLAALGGRDNVLDLGIFAGRLLIRMAQPDQIDVPGLKKLGIRGVARSAADAVQVLVAGPADAWGEPLRRLL